jgi:polar amino acid transport system substrate-binding protein
VDSYDAGIKRVLDRNSDVFFGDRAILLEAAKRSPSAGDLVVLDRLFTYEPLALALARNDDDFRLTSTTCTGNGSENRTRACVRSSG